MPVVVITPPEPIVLPKDIAGSHAADDATVAALIQAATEEIDGPDGWVGRCFGPQTLELRRDGFTWPFSSSSKLLPLPCPPLIDIVSVKYDDANGVERTMPATDYRLVAGHGLHVVSAAGWPTTRSAEASVRVRYRAGYDGQEGRGQVPERARQAVIMGARALIGLTEQRMIRSSAVEGIGTKSFVGADIASAALRQTSERLLSTLRVYA